MSATVRIIVRGTNWLGDSVITIPAVRALRAILRAMRRLHSESQNSNLRSQIQKPQSGGPGSPRE